MRLSDKVSSDNLRQKLGIEDIETVLRRNRLRWYGHIYRKLDDDWVKGSMNFVVEGRVPRGRPRKTWNEMIENDLRILGLQKEDACDRKEWRRLIQCVESDGDDSGDQEGIEPSDGSPGVTPGLYPMGGYGP